MNPVLIGLRARIQCISKVDMAEHESQKMIDFTIGLRLLYEFAITSNL